MKLKRLALITAMISSNVNAFQVCNIGDEYNVLDSESFHQIRQKTMMPSVKVLLLKTCFHQRQSTLST